MLDGAPEAGVHTSVPNLTRRSSRERGRPARIMCMFIRLHQASRGRHAGQHLAALREGHEVSTHSSFACLSRSGSTSSRPFGGIVMRARKTPASR